MFLRTDYESLYVRAITNEEEGKIDQLYYFCTTSHKISSLFTSFIKLFISYKLYEKNTNNN